MANYANLLATIAANIYTNNNNEVTAAMVKTAVDSMVASLGAGYQFMGVATPATTPGSTDIKQFYIASEAGTYTDFLDSNADPIEVGSGEVAVLKYETAWSKDTAISIDVADGSITFQKLAADVLDVLSSVLPIVRTGNLYNELLNKPGYYIANTGTIRPDPDSIISDFIPVTPGEDYTISVASLGRVRALAFYDADKSPITQSLNIVGTHTAPAGAAYMVVMPKYTTQINAGIMIVAGSSPQPYMPYGQISTDKIKDFENEVLAIAGSGASLLPLRVTKSGNDLVISKGGDSLTSKIQTNLGDEYGNNPFFCFQSFVFNGYDRSIPDDVAPTHTQRTTIGANHGQPCNNATVEGHGLDNTAIGTEWTDGNGIKFYIMRIVDEDHLIFLSENRSLPLTPTYVSLDPGVLDDGNGNNLVVTSVASVQLYPVVTNQKVSLYVDDNLVTEDGTYPCNEFKVIESYDILGTDSVLQNIIARAGTDAPPEYEGDVATSIETSYIFHRSTDCVIVQNIIPRLDVAFQNAMVTQAIRRSADSKYYVPGSLILPNGLDLRVPTIVPWSSALLPIGISSAYWADPTNPVRRVLQFFNGDQNGFAVGYLPDKGVGADPASYTDDTFELRNNTGKIYPHVIDSNNVAFTTGDIYTAIMYRCNFIPEASGNRLSLYHFHFDGAEYVFVDYSGSMLDRVVLDDDFAGKTIEALELRNCTLENDIYNGGFYVNATYVAGDTCYAVLKIK